ncbi:MAG: arsenite methyltransferase [Ignavibacteria bacterium]
MENTEIKKEIKKAYTNVLNERSGGCCSPECCGTGESISDDYKDQTGYVSEADLGLGCGIPTEFAGIKEGNTVLDLGSGAGNDVFIASKAVGENGKVIGLDMTEAMIARANFNKEKSGFTNVEFVLGEIEEMPLMSESFDVVLSNCVLNLVQDKVKAFKEIYRVLKKGGHFTISDIVVSGGLPEKILKAAEMYSGCIAGAMNKEEYLKTISVQGFSDIKIYKEKNIELSDELMLKHLNRQELSDYKSGNNKILSITIYGKKP